MRLLGCVCNTCKNCDNCCCSTRLVACCAHLQKNPWKGKKGTTLFVTHWPNKPTNAGTRGAVFVARLCSSPPCHHLRLNDRPSRTSAALPTWCVLCFSMELPYIHSHTVYMVYMVYGIYGVWCVLCFSIGITMHAFTYGVYIRCMVYMVYTVCMVYTVLANPRCA